MVLSGNKSFTEPVLTRSMSPYSVVRPQLVNSLALSHRHMKVLSHQLTDGRIGLVAVLPCILVILGGVLVGLFLLHDVTHVFIRLAAGLKNSANTNRSRYNMVNRACHPGGEYRNYYPDALALNQVTETHWKGHHFLYTGNIKEFNYFFITRAAS